MNFGRQILDFEPFSIYGTAPYEVVESSGEASFFDELRARLAEGAKRYPAGGAIGFVGYEATRALEPRAFSTLRVNDLGLPLARLVFYRELRREMAEPVTGQNLKFKRLPDTQEARSFYESGVKKIRRYIEAGDIYQANLTCRFSFSTSHDAATIYERLRGMGPAPRSGLLQWDDFSVVSNSPETFLTLKNGILEAKPIKGTIRRGQSAAEDERLRQELADSAKDRAENVMIVDLLRNDMGRVCEFGSIEVPKLYSIETFPTLHHGVSTVRGQLRSGCDALDAFLAAFPCGSITGAPKMRAMQILSELEPVPRGVAMGSIGYFGFNGNMEWSVAIRTATLHRGTISFHVGGGIVADSQPEAEYEEMRLKASALYTAISA